MLATSETTKQKPHLPQITLSQPPAKKHSSFVILRVFLLPAQTPLSFQTVPECLRDSQNLRIKECGELHPAGFACAACYIVSAQGFLMCLWVFTNMTPFFSPLNHLRVKLLCSWSSPINAANMTR